MQSVLRHVCGRAAIRTAPPVSCNSGQKEEDRKREGGSTLTWGIQAPGRKQLVRVTQDQDSGLSCLKAGHVVYVGRSPVPTAPSASAPAGES